jgi:phage terminase large subunit
MKLLPKQNHAVYYLKDSETTEVLYGGAAGGGKSALGCLWLIEMSQHYPGSRWLMGRSKLKTLRETTLNTFFQLTSNLGLSNQFRYNAQEHIIFWNNGSEILLKDLFLYPADPEFDSLGSLEITGAFIDECNQIVYKAWQIVKSRIRYKLNEFGLRPKMLGSCNPAKNWTKTEFYNPAKNNTLPKTKKFIQALPTDNPHLPPSYLESLAELDKNSKERLLFGNWDYDDDPTVLIGYDNIINCFSNNFVEAGKKYITADIARYGRDKTVIGIWSGYRLFKVITIPKSGLDEVKEQLERLRVEHNIPLSQIIVDEDGVGGGIVDFMKCKGFVNGSSPLDVAGKTQNFRNLKSQCYFGISDRINSNQLFFQSDGVDKQAIIEELQYVKQKNMDKDGKREVLSKDEVKLLLGRSPDYADMIMMRYWFELKPSFEWYAITE